MKAQEILKNVNDYIKTSETIKATRGYAKKWDIRNHCEQLGIFDWWNDTLSVSQLKQMKKFLETAIELGYTGYACFKVGAKYCAHGMWAYKADSTDGYAPKGAALYHSFLSGCNSWAMTADGIDWSDELTLKQIKEAH